MPIRLKDTKPGQIITLNRTPSGPFVYDVILSKHEHGVRVLRVDSSGNNVETLEYSRYGASEFRLAELKKNEDGSGKFVIQA